ncbi:MAG: sulfatase-like hydrolase/transferase [Aeoliella sp.]
MLHRSFRWCLGLLLLGCGLLAGSNATAATSQPNIVLFFADDAGYADFGFQDVTEPDMQSLTPHIDSIASEGVRFTSGYVSGCVCSPSRAGLLTGRYQQRFGHELNIPPGYIQGGMPLAESTLADRMGAAGYKTGIIGKWHLGYPGPYQPNKRGFDHFYGLLQGSRGYFATKNISPHRVIQLNGKPTPETGYVTDRFGQGAVDFIELNKDEPFFLFVSFTAPHGPLHAKKEDLAALTHIENRRRRTYAAMVKSMDDNIGLVLDALRDQGLEENTLIVFTNDNGGQTGTGAVNRPLRGKKGTLWEGGVRVPMAMKWRGKIKPQMVVDDPVIALDFTPTFLAAGGNETGSDWKLDGIDLLPRLTGQVDALPERHLYWRGHGPDGDSAIRQGDWKLILPDHAPGTAPELYNLATDIGETDDVADKHPARVKSLGARLAAWESQLIDPLWGNPRPRGRKNRRQPAAAQP